MDFHGNFITLHEYVYIHIFALSMSPRKILFFIIVGISVLIIGITLFFLQKKSTQKTVIPNSLKIWITDGTTQGYDALVKWFQAYAPEYKNMNIIFEKKTTDPIRYRTLLLSTMTDGTGPDIFMVGAGEDVVLDWKIEPIPEELIDFSDFGKKYDDIFLSLITSTGSEDIPTRYLKGVPLWFETLGIFYNKNLVRNLPKTWNELDSLYNKGIDTWIFVSNLWLGPRYTENAADIIALFYQKTWGASIMELKAWGTDGLVQYMNYKDIQIPTITNDDTYAPIITLWGRRSDMDAEKLTTLDLFMQWDIGMIIWYPSLINALEKSDKRAWINSKASTILTEKIPLDEYNWTRKNIVKYNYFALSKASDNDEAAIKFLEYLMTPEAEQIFLQNNSYLISAQREFWGAQEGTQLSKVLSRATMDAFIPTIDDTYIVFSYGLKAEFENFVSEYIDRNWNLDIYNISEQISRDIWCSIDTYSGKDIRADCEKK